MKVVWPKWRQVISKALFNTKNHGGRRTFQCKKDLQMSNFTFNFILSLRQEPLLVLTHLTGSIAAYTHLQTAAHSSLYVVSCSVIGRCELTLAHWLVGCRSYITACQWSSAVVACIIVPETRIGGCKGTECIWCQRKPHNPIHRNTS